MVEREVVRALCESELERIERLAAPFWGAGGAPGTGSDRKAALSAAVDEIDARLASRHRQEAGCPELDELAAALGCVLALELGLEWVRVETEQSCESALRLRSIDASSDEKPPILFFPRRMMVRQLEQTHPMSVAQLVATTRAYVASLRRFFPAIAG